MMCILIKTYDLFLFSTTNNYEWNIEFTNDDSEDYDYDYDEYDYPYYTDDDDYFDMFY